MAKNPWTEEEKAIAYPMRKSGKTYREIGETVGRSADNVARFFHRLNLGDERKKGNGTIAVMRGLGHGKWEPSPEQLADLARREAAPHTAFGDPTTRRWDSNADADSKVRAEVDDGLTLASIRNIQKNRKGNFAVVRKYKMARTKAMEEATAGESQPWQSQSLGTS